MKIHTNTLTARTIFAAVPLRCYLAFFTDKDGNSTDIEQSGSRSHDRGYTVRLSGSSPYNMAKLSDKSATWDEWGNFIAELFRLDIHAKIGHYDSLDAFIEFTTAERDRISEYRPDLAPTHQAPWLDDNDLVFASARGYYKAA